jgi:tyrosyl-DNA phosphodiesterase 2
MSTMNEIFSKAIKDSELLRKAEVPWQPDEPFAQPYHIFDTMSSLWTAKTAHGQLVHQTGITSIALYSWNIDFMLPFGEVRMKAALDHLGGLVKDLASTPWIAPVIFLQECTPEDLITISSNPWVRQRFILTDLDATYWATNHYGTTVLLDTSLLVTSVFRVHYSQSRMDRDAFFVDVALGPDNGGKVIRICNTHLESLAMDPPLRPAQVRLVAQYMHAEEVHAALAAGDFNAIQPFDRTLHKDNNLKDAFLEQNGKEDSEEGYTWGQQAATKFREQFGCSRMDKVYYCGSLKLLEFIRFGQDTQLPEGTDGGPELKRRNEIVALGFDKPWITDHLGILAKFDIVQRKEEGSHL